MSSQQTKITGVFCLALLEQLMCWRSTAGTGRQILLPLPWAGGASAPRRHVPGELPPHKVGTCHHAWSQRQHAVPWREHNCAEEPAGSRFKACE